MRKEIQLFKIKDNQILSMFYDDWEASINVSEGANLYSLKDASRNLDVIHDKDQFGKKVLDFPFYGVPVLFPPNRISNGKFTANGKEYAFPINDAWDMPNHVHGFLFYEDFKVTDIAVCDDNCSATLTYVNNKNSKFFSNFNHEFTFDIRFILNEAGITQELKVVNNGEHPMPFGLGFHTFLKIPFSTNGDPTKCKITATIDKRWTLDDLYIPTGELISLNDKEKDYLSEGVFINGKPIAHHYTANPILRGDKSFNGVVLSDNSINQSVIYSVGSEFGHWMFWNADGKAGYFCPEPQTICADAFNLKDTLDNTGFLMLQPDEKWTSFSTISVESCDK